MNGRLSFERSTPLSTFCSSSRERGPATAYFAHCSLTDSACVSSAGQITCLAKSICCITFPGVRGRGGEVEVLIAEACDSAVIEHNAVLTQHHAIACLTNRKRR